MIFLQTIARADVPWSAVWRGSRCSMDTNRCHRAGEDALEAPRMAIAVPDELQGRGTEALYGRVWQFGELPANHRAGGCALERCLEWTAARRFTGERESGIYACGDLVAMLGCHSGLLILEYRFSVA